MRDLLCYIYHTFFNKVNLRKNQLNWQTSETNGLGLIFQNEYGNKNWRTHQILDKKAREIGERIENSPRFFCFHRMCVCHLFSCCRSNSQSKNMQTFKNRKIKFIFVLFRFGFQTQLWIDVIEFIEIAIIYGLNLSFVCFALNSIWNTLRDKNGKKFLLVFIFINIIIFFGYLHRHLCIVRKVVRFWFKCVLSNY